MRRISLVLFSMLLGARSIEPPQPKQFMHKVTAQLMP